MIICLKGIKPWRHFGISVLLLSPVGITESREMKFVIIDYHLVREDNEPGPATRFNTAFCTPDQLPESVDHPSEEPYALSEWLPLIAESRGVSPSVNQVVRLTSTQARLLIDASAVSIITGTLSRAHKEDLDEIVRPAFSTLTYPSDGGSLFMRLDGCSPKDASCRLHNGEKPQSLILSTTDILLRLTTTQRAAKDLTKSLARGPHSGIPIFFAPFNSRMGSAMEYRVFCIPGSGRVSAVSQYQWHKPWRFQHLARDKHRAVAQDIMNKIEALHAKIMSSLLPDQNSNHRTLLDQGFSFDVFFDEEGPGIAQLVEVNVFGSRSGLGTCLFEWVRDFDILYGKASDEVEFRITL